MASDGSRRWCGEYLATSLSSFCLSFSAANPPCFFFFHLCSVVIKRVMFQGLFMFFRIKSRVSWVTHLLKNFTAVSILWWFWFLISEGRSVMWFCLTGLFVLLTFGMEHFFFFLNYRFCFPFSLS